MRLEFNYVVIDDDFNDEDDRSNIDNLIKKINQKLEDKGFIPKCLTYSSKNEFENALSNIKDITYKRIDLYLSDNNLGNSGGKSDNNEHAHDGIEIYMNLKKEFICDFILYTRSDTKEIVEKMITFLSDYQNPSLFTRFNFIARNSNDDWHEQVLALIDFIITKREEMNNLRGLFAEKISTMDLHLKTILNRSKDEKFKVTVNSIPSQYLTNPKIKKYLHNLRQIRNALLHCDEEFDIARKEYKITYKEEGSTKQKIIYESDSNEYRKRLLKVYAEVMSWKK